MQLGNKSTTIKANRKCQGDKKKRRYNGAAAASCRRKNFRCILLCCSQLEFLYSDCWHSPTLHCRHTSAALHLITLTFGQQSILDDARLQQKSRQQQTQCYKDVHKGCRRSSMRPEGAQSSTSCLLLEAIMRRQRAATLLGASCQFDAIVCQVSNLSSKRNATL